MRSQVPSLELSRARLARTLPSSAHGARIEQPPYGPILEQIRGHAAAGRVACIPRALNRGGGVHLREVRHALATGRDCHRRDHGRFVVESTDLSGNPLSVVVVIDEDELVVTALEGARP